MKMNLNEAELGLEYVITKIDTEGDDEIESFLFSLGCYSGEKITVVDKKKNLVVSIKDARYNIDPELGAAIHVMKPFFQE
jgi:ferrous iron transport protein A